MTRGTVTPQLEPLLQLRVRRRGGSERTVAALLDTGFNDFVALPPRVVQELALERLGQVIRVEVADGAVVTCELFGAEIEWEGDWRSIPVMALEGESLVGMLMLHGSEIRIVAIAGGDVTIDKHAV